MRVHLLERADSCRPEPARNKYYEIWPSQVRPTFYLFYLTFLVTTAVCDIDKNKY